MDIGRYVPGSVLFQDFKIRMTYAIFRNLGNTPTVSDLLIKLDSIGAKRDFIDLINFVK